MKKLLRKYLVKKDGVAAIEFAILAPVFFALMSAVFEISYFVYMTTAVQRGVENAIYEMRTGHIYVSVIADDVPPEQWIKQKICETVSISSCMSTIQISTQKYNADFDVFYNSSTTGVVDAGTSGVLMRMEATVTYPNILFAESIFGTEAMQMHGGLTFMTEPYSS